MSELLFQRGLAIAGTAEPRVGVSDCPECGLPAEILDQYTLPSTDGPVEHVKVQCVVGHYFNCPAEYLERGPDRPADLRQTFDR